MLPWGKIQPPRSQMHSSKHDLLRATFQGSIDVSENTVKYHIKKILQKLNAQNRTEAVAYALRSGLLKKEPT